MSSISLKPSATRRRPAICSPSVIEKVESASGTDTDENIGVIVEAERELDTAVAQKHLTIELQKLSEKMRPLPADIHQSSPFRAFLDDIERLGVRPVSEGGTPYAVIAARSNPRWWLLPLNNRRTTVAGLDMLHPVSLSAKVAKIGARVVAQLGAHRLLGKSQIRLSGQPDLASGFDTKDLHFAYFTGTAGPHRKTTLQIMEKDGVIRGFAKMSRAAHIRPYIRHEAEMLAHVAALGLPSADVPQVLALRDDPELTLLVTDSSKPTNVASPLKPTAQHLRWLHDLCTRTGHVGAGSLLEDLEKQLSAVEAVAGIDWCNRITQALTTLRPLAGEIQLCLVHGDFTPWNCFVQGERLYVFDWEYANLAWPAGYDLVHFLMAPIPPDQKVQILPHVHATLTASQFGGDKKAAARALLLSLACHSLFYIGRLAESEGAIADWTEGPVHGAMIDTLLKETRLIK